MLTVEDLGMYDFFEYNNELYFLLNKDHDCERGHVYNLERHETENLRYDCEVTFVPLDRIEIKLKRYPK